MLTRRDLIKSLSASSAIIAAPGLVNAQGQPTFRIGALNPITNGSNYGAGMQKMIAAAAQAVNDAGGAAGRRFEVFSEDAQANPQAGVLAAKKLIEINKVQAILGTWASGVSLAVAPLTNDANIFLMNTSGAPALSVPPANAKGLLYRFQGTNDRWGRAYYQAALKEGFKRPATMALNNAAAISVTEGFSAAWETDGKKIVEKVIYEPNQASYRSELQKILAAKPDVIVMGSYLADLTILLREWYQSGEQMRFITPTYAANPELVKALGADVVEGLISVDTVPNESAPAYKLFDDTYRKVMGQPGSTNSFAAMTWDMVTVLALAMEAANSAEIAAVNAKMREVANPPGQVVSSFAEG
ncbi:MAG TPA: ABC transporter substrate-binding protein, partial [Sphingomicrobium sp.]|nr:ABC transporter substrate-binding protein [Sphingomicrobium sp.]